MVSKDRLILIALAPDGRLCAQGGVVIWEAPNFWAGTWRLNSLTLALHFSPDPEVEPIFHLVASLINHEQHRGLLGGLTSRPTDSPTIFRVQASDLIELMTKLMTKMRAAGHPKGRIRKLIPFKLIIREASKIMASLVD